MKNKRHKIKKILLIRMSSMGDVILTSPLVRQLRRSFPDAQIDYLIRTEYADLVKFNPHLTHTLQYDVQTRKKGLRELREYLKKQGYDAVFDLHRNFRSFYLRRFSSKSLFLKVNKNRIIRFLLIKFNINLYKKIYDNPLSIAEKYLKTASKLMEVRNDLKLDLYLPQKIADKGKQLWRKLEFENFGLIIAPGSRHFTKRWPTELYSELIMKIHQTYGWRTLLVGSPEESSLAEDIQKKTGNGACEVAAGYFSLLQTAALIKACPLFISNDSGLMHVAAAFEKPQIAIFGSTTQELGFFPVNPRAVVVENQNLKCRPCTHIGRESCPKKHFKCMVEITPQRVLKTINEMTEKEVLKNDMIINVTN
jgi:lipopolysaccharide heptosyltransferase II